MQNKDLVRDLISVVRSTDTQENKVYRSKQLLTNYWQTACESPILLDVHSHLLNKKGSFYVPCGKCWQCLFDKQSDFVSRVYLHTLYYKHWYYITLGFKSVDERPDKRSGNPAQLLFRKFPYLLWNKDDINIKHRETYSPSVLSKIPVQNFLKRLKKNLHDDTFSYLVSGEYGHRFGRPHYHLLLWSNEELTPEMIKDAWSIKYHKDKKGKLKLTNFGKATPLSFAIDDQIDFNDLMLNGTWLRRDYALTNNVKNCVGYVTKYVNKQNEYNDTRVRLGYELYKDNPDLLNDLFTISNGKNDPFPIARFPEQSPLPHGGFSPCDFENFRQMVRPFRLTSNHRAIGKDYFKDNVARFQEGNNSLPSSDFGSLSFPAYYRYLAKKACYPFRFGNKDIPDSTHATPFKDYYTSVDSHVRNAYNTKLFETDPLYYLSRAFKDVSTFRDSFSNLTYTFDPSVHKDTDGCLVPSLQWMVTRYNFHTKKYEYVDNVDLSSLRFLCESAEQKYNKIYSSRFDESLQNSKYFDECHSMLLDIGFDFGKELTDFNQLKTELRNERQKRYHLDHNHRAYE